MSDELYISQQIMIFLFPAGMFLLWFYYRKDMESRDERIKVLEDNMKELTEISTELKTIIKYHEEDIKELKDRV